MGWEAETHRLDFLYLLERWGVIGLSEIFESDIPWVATLEEGSTGLAPRLIYEDDVSVEFRR